MTEPVSKPIVDLVPLPLNEVERLQALRRYNILDTPPEAAFDRVTSLAARLFGVPTALVSLVDESRAWFKSCYGFDLQEVPRDATICSFALLSDDVLVVPDAREDDRFACNAFVQSEPGLRFYAGAPLLTQDGFNLGTLCLLDTKPRDAFTEEQRANLVDLAAIVVDELELRLALAMKTAAERKRQQAEEKQQEAAQHLQLYADVVRNAQVGIVVWHLEDSNNPGSFRLLVANPAASKATGLDFEPLIGKTMAESFPQLLQTPLVQQYLEVVCSGRSLDLGEVPYSRDGISAGMYTLKAFSLPDRCLGLAFENITTRKQMEAQLQESQYYNQQIAEAMPGVLFVHDLIQQQNIYTNRQIADLLGYTSEQIQAMGANAVAILVHPDDLARIFAYVESFRSAPDGSVLGIEYQARHANGQPRWIYSQSVVFNRTAAGLPRQLLGVSIDITERKQAEAAVAAQEQRYRYIFESVNVAIWEEDFSRVKAAIEQLKATGIQDFRQYFSEHPEFVQQMASLVRVENVNQAALQMFGTQEKAELLASLNQIFIPETQEAFVGELLAIADGASSFAAETVLQTLQGDRLDVWFTITFPPESEPYSNVLVSLLDITQRKRAEQALQQHSERLNLLYETTSDLLSAKQPLELMDDLFSRLSAQLDLHYYYHFQVTEEPEPQRLRLINSSGISAEQAEAFEVIELGQDLCGWVAQERRQIVLNQAEIAAHPHAQLFYSMGVSAYAGQPLMVHGRLLGTLSFASLTRSQFTPAEVNLLQAISEQVAIALDRANLVASLQQQTEDLVQANQVKDEFLAVLSHELRSPLNPILGWTKLLQTGKFDPQKTKQALDIIERNAKQQTQLIDDLLDISRILRGKLALSEAPVDLVNTIESALETVRLAAEAKNISINTTFDSSISIVLGDAGRLQQIVWNLLSNAIKFTPNGGRVEVRLGQMGPEAEIQVKDTGKGIAPEFLPHVFESFRQEDGRTTRKFGGLGLGLAIVRQLSELHGGTVRAESLGEGTGATFTIRLPLMKTSSASAGDTNQTPIESNGVNALQGIRILVVDDEADMRDLAVTILEGAGATVQMAASASEALTVLDQFQPMLLVSDLGMPETDGYELIQQVKSRSSQSGKQILAIALSAYAMEQDQQQALAAGFQRHIAKPIEPEVLVQEIVTLLNQE